MAKGVAKPKAMRWSTFALVSLLASCHGGGPGFPAAQLVEALITGTVAVSAAAANRAAGDCYAACEAGTICNPVTGWCDPLPCHDSCDDDEVCVVTATGEACQAYWLKPPANAADGPPPWWYPPLAPASQPTR